jgi:hypothetical protein
MDMECHIVDQFDFRLLLRRLRTYVVWSNGNIPDPVVRSHRYQDQG